MTKTLALAFLAALMLAAPASAAGGPSGTGKTLSASLLGKTLQP